MICKGHIMVRCHITLSKTFLAILIPVNMWILSETSIRNLHVSLVLQVCPHQCWGEGTLPQPAGNTLPNAAQDAIDFCCSKGTLLVHVQVSTRISRSFSAKLLPSQSAPTLYWCLRLLLLTCGEDFSFSSVELHEFLPAHFSSLLRSPWTAAQPSGISATPPWSVSSANFLKVHSAHHRGN